MIRRLYIDGYKAFVNHTIEFDHMVFLAGGNGTGKSGHFDILSAVRKLAYEGQLVNDCFSEACFSQLISAEEPKISVDVFTESSLGNYRYSLVVRKSVSGMVIDREVLSRNGEEIYRFADGVAMIATFGQRSTEIPVSSYRSGLPLLAMGRGERQKFFFLSEIANLQIIRLNPFDLSDTAFPSSAFLDPSGKNFVSWLYGEMLDFTKARKVVARWERGFGAPLNPTFEPLDNGGRFKLEVRYGNSLQVARISDLSEGQRCLLIIHALLALAEGKTLLLDEPDNFLSYREVQGLISDVQELSLSDSTQIIMASHNPSLMRALGGTYGFRFYRDPTNGHVRYSNLAQESEGIYADLVVLEEERPD